MGKVIWGAPPPGASCPSRTARRSLVSAMKLAWECSRRAVALLALSAVPQAWSPPRALATMADRVDPTTGKLVLNMPPTINVLNMPPKITSRCYLDVSIGGEPVGRLDIDLY